MDGSFNQNRKSETVIIVNYGQQRKHMFKKAPFKLTGSQNNGNYTSKVLLSSTGFTGRPLTYGGGQGTETGTPAIIGEALGNIILLKLF